MNNDSSSGKLTTANYDIRGHSIWRVLRQDMIFRVLPFGSFGGGPNLVFIARLLLLHTMGGVGVWLYSRSGLVRHISQKLIQWFKR